MTYRPLALTILSASTVLLAACAATPQRNAAPAAPMAAHQAREAVVNLKLPMKQRYAEVCKLLQRLQDAFAERRIKVAIACKQLYHDREEVTCHLRRL